MSDSREDPADLRDAGPTDADLKDYDALPEDDSDDPDGSVERIDIGENEGPELTAGVLDDTESVAPRPGHDPGA